MNNEQNDSILNQSRKEVHLEEKNFRFSKSAFVNIIKPNISSLFRVYCDRQTTGNAFYNEVSAAWV